MTDAHALERVHPVALDLDGVALALEGPGERLGDRRVVLGQQDRGHVDERIPVDDPPSRVAGATSVAVTDATGTRRPRPFLVRPRRDEDPMSADEAAPDLPVIIAGGLAIGAAVAMVVLGPQPLPLWCAAL